MQIKDIENLAELAKLEMTTEEKEAILKDLDGILAYVKTIESIELNETESEYDKYNVWREDKEVNREFSRDLLLKQFPDSQDDFLKVKKIL